MKRTPLKAIISYIAITFGLSLSGIVIYNDYEWMKVGIYITLVCMAIWMGYSVKNTPRVSRISKKSTDRRLKNLIFYTLIVFFCLEAISLMKNMVVYNIDTISGLISRMGNVGAVYTEALRFAKTNTAVNNVVRIITMLGIGKQIIIVGYFHYWKEISKGKGLFLAYVGLIVVNIVAFKGTQKDFAEYVIYFISVFLVHFGIQKKRINYKKIGIVVVGLFCIFAVFQYSRAVEYNVQLNNFTTDYFSVNSQNFLYRLFGPAVGYSLSIMIYYISGGYYGLSKSLSVPFKWTYGLGGSFALSSYANQYLGVPNMVDFSYPARAEAYTGYPAKMYWSTAFPWLASDFTFVGVILLIAIIAFIYKVAWVEGIEYGNFLSILMFSRLNIFWAFIIANNQLMQTRESAIATIVLVVFWVLLHQKFNCIKREAD